MEEETEDWRGRLDRISRGTKPDSHEIPTTGEPKSFGELYIYSRLASKMGLDSCMQAFFPALPLLLPGRDGEGP